MAKTTGKGYTGISLNGQHISVNSDSIADEVHKAAQEQIEQAEEHEYTYVSKLSFARDNHEDPMQFPTFTVTVNADFGASDNLFIVLYRHLFDLKRKAARRMKAFARWN